MKKNRRQVVGKRMSSESYSFRLVVLGGGKVGKTSIISRMLHNTFPQCYVETVEDLHYRCVKIDGKNYQVNILDTAGVLQFPAMRRLSICNAQGFLLVYEVTEPRTLQQLKAIIEEIKDKVQLTELVNPKQHWKQNPIEKSSVYSEYLANVCQNDAQSFDGSEKGVDKPGKESAPRNDDHEDRNVDTGMC
ncbi:GTP-binding protein Di-Ras2-like [Convolutriloba macropyga]|uniref:GTP-binding protein Di-Ras2-like n=1 Tax=Convolutriloba macropyga TaxID=536237 RepID=UPI003F521B15